MAPGAGTLIDALVLVAVAGVVALNVPRRPALVALDLAGVLLAVALALRLASPGASLAGEPLGASETTATVLAFAALFAAAQVPARLVARRLVAGDGRPTRPLRVSVTAVLAGAQALVLVGVVVAVGGALSAQFAADVEASRLGGALFDRERTVERLAPVPSVGDAAGTLPPPPALMRSVPLPVAAERTAPDPRAEARLLDRVNAERERAGLPALQVDEELARVARAHSRDMWGRDYFGHTDADGLGPFDRLQAAGIGYGTAAENVALAPDAAAAHEALMASPSHRRNVLDGAFGRIGIGVVDGGAAGAIFTQVFTD